MDKSTIILILISFCTIIFQAETVRAPSDMGLAVVNMGNVDELHADRWTAGTPRWLGTNSFLFYTNETAYGDKFYVSVEVYDAVDLFAWQFKLWFNATLLNCTSVWKPGWWIYADYPPYIPIDAVINNDEGYVVYGSSLVVGPGFSGDGTLCLIGFQIVKEPTAQDASFECDLTFDLLDTYHIDSNLEVIPTQHIPGHYRYMFSSGEIHDVAITNITVFIGEAASVPPNLSIEAKVTVENQGTTDENFNVTLYFGKETVDTFRIVDLPAGLRVNVTFEWCIFPIRAMIWPPPWDHPREPMYRTVLLKAEAETVPGEIDTADNLYIDGLIHAVWLVPDVNGDGKMDMRDIGAVVRAFGSYPGSPRWDVFVDFNSDGLIDMKDVAVSASIFGANYIEHVLASQIFPCDLGPFLNLH